MPLSIYIEPSMRHLLHYILSLLKLVNKFGNLNSIKYYSNYQTYLLILIDSVVSEWS